ncbi:hypothetical protein L2E82_47197 [Cichorium intybus]|uniref:Uncharacterized protein n=1 Tax=Cichorium intybus TaxID=13427 RepID=A0ACB8YWB0_CICIN|nr:hypothetical protein L2E82_47197 [Cichorium intybus]
MTVTGGQQMVKFNMNGAGYNQQQQEYNSTVAAASTMMHMQNRQKTLGYHAWNTTRFCLRDLLLELLHLKNLEPILVLLGRVPFSVNRRCRPIRWSTRNTIAIGAAECFTFSCVP